MYIGWKTIVPLRPRPLGPGRAAFAPGRRGTGPCGNSNSNSDNNNHHHNNNNNNAIIIIMKSIISSITNNHE